MVFAWTFPGGKLKQEVTEIVLVNDTAKTVDATVPVGKQWILLSFKATNIDDVDRGITVILYKEAAKTNNIKRLMSETVTAGGAWAQWPTGANVAVTQKEAAIPCEILAAGNTLAFVWAKGGASAGGTDADGLVVCYLEIDV